jgi:putative nucleotidyltransferase with HDIG domain
VGNPPPQDTLKFVLVTHSMGGFVGQDCNRPGESASFMDRPHRTCWFPLKGSPAAFRTAFGTVGLPLFDEIMELIQRKNSDVFLGHLLDCFRTFPSLYQLFPNRSGLLEHILSICNLSAALVAHYPRLNLDWLIAGAILHDLGKIKTLELTGVRFAYTTRGQLIEHITLGLEILEKRVFRFPQFPDGSLA